jgi:hypothetical protein
MRTNKRINARWTAPTFRAASAALLVMLVSTSASGASPDARGDIDARISVTAVAGKVDVTMAGEAVTVERDATVLLPARIVTGHDGMLGLTQAGTNISVSSDTEIEIPAEAADGNLVARLVQHRGNVFYDVAPRDVGKLRVETPFLVAVIKGTQFNVAVDTAGTTISLFEGHLEIRTPDDSDVFELNAGEIAIRSLIDDSIRIVGMDDERAAAPRAPAPAAADEAAAEEAPSAAAQREREPAAADGPAAADVVAESAAPRKADDRAGPANDAVDRANAVDRAKELGVVTAGIDALAVPGVMPVEPGPALVALEQRNEHARGRGPARDRDEPSIEVALAIDVLGDPIDVGLDARLDAADETLDVALEPLPDVGDAELDLGGELDLGVDTDVDLGDVADSSVDEDLTLEPALDVGVDVGLDDAPSVDIDLDADASDLELDVLPGLDDKLDLDLLDVKKPERVTRPHGGLARAQ